MATVKNFMCLRYCNFVIPRDFQEKVLKEKCLGITTLYFTGGTQQVKRDIINTHSIHKTKNLLFPKENVCTLSATYH